MGVGAGGTPPGTDRQMGGSGEQGATVPCARGGSGRERPCSARLQTRATGHSRGGSGDVSFQTVPHGLSVVLLRDWLGAEGEAWPGWGKGAMTWYQGGDGLPTKGGCGGTLLLLPPRAKCQGGRQEDAGGAQDGGSGPGPTLPKVQVGATATPLLWPWKA